MAGGMATTHLSRTGKDALSLKVDLEAALLSCYGYQGQARARPRSTSQMQSRLMHLQSRGKDQHAQRDLLHGYMFDAWSGRKCADQFLELNAKWPLNTDAYLKLLTGLGLGDQLLSTLMTVTHKESMRLIGLILESSEVTAELFRGLFIWTVDQVDAHYRKKQVQSNPQEASNNPGEFIGMWTDRAKECESIRRLFRVSFKNTLRQLILQQNRRQRGGISYWDLGDKAQIDEVQSGVADEIIQGLLADVIAILVEHPVQGEVPQFGEEIYGDLRRWDHLCAGGSGSKLSELLSSVERSAKRRKHEETKTRISNDILQAVLQRDAELLTKESQSNTASQENRSQISPYSNHQEAFMIICDNFRRQQDFPGYPPTPMSRLTTYKLQCHNQERAQVLQEHIEWVESTIRIRSTGWLSCVKLKLQFFAVFGESYINEELADIVCEHDLHWDLISTLLRYLRRHRADPARMPADTFQLGCELLLSVFTKRVGIRLCLRDHLFYKSNAICKDTRGPLFGSWGFWRMNIDTLLTSTLNQIVVSDDSPQSSAVSPHTIEALVKISLIAPYRVLSRVVHSIIVNRGQCALLLQAILELGQLAWLRASPSEPTLLLSVLQHLLYKPTAHDSDPGLTWSEQQQDNFVDFVVKAMTKRSPTTGMSLLDPTEFLVDCVAPFLDELESGHLSSLFQSITRILLTIYERGSVQASTTTEVMESERPIPRGIQLRILLRLLQLRTIHNPWVAEGHDSHRKTTVERSGGEHLDGLTRLCETIVRTMAAYVSSLAEYDQEERELFEGFGQAVQEASGALVDLESRLITVPLMDACQNLTLDMGLPSLPEELFYLCGDRLRAFKYSCSISQNLGILTMDKAAEAIVLFLGLGRMCDHVLADMIQAIDFGYDLPPSTQHILRLTMTPALYRVLSISTRHQSHRLLTHAVPVIAQLWGGPSNPNLYWDGLDSSSREKQLPVLGSYWDSFKRGSRQQDEENSETTESSTLLKNVGNSLDILLTLTTVLRFSLEPLPSKGLESVLQICQSDLGYDMMPDHVASLVQSTFKAIRIEWTKVPLDHLLYCFMKVCEMSNIVDTQHQTNTFPNRLTPHAEIEPPSSTDESAACWRSAYLDFMSQPMDDSTKRQLDVARAKARDELVLMAMNLSEALVNHHDSFYDKALPGLAGIYDDVDDIGDGGGSSRGRGRGGRGRGRGVRGQKGAAASRELARGSGPQSRNRQEARQAATSTLDKGTQAWFNGIMATPAAQEPSATLNEEDSTDICASNAAVSEPTTSTSSNVDPVASVRDENEASKAMLNADQVDCLLLALAYLPAQESQAVRSRLHRLLNLQPAQAPRHS
ncbi:hypothetical protein K457DRAFT_141470 [Linnemannia elongata AG-77]|uniref:Uncharacterized protein n=1 Tax=Linnemannia elongata AG-77 TaxID=1314771 RepID=A0A197JIY7_9FUNG|nr:hypothetical protein K457DRAFT_141470 [Linnemannia elongata AG-77]